MWNLAAAWAGYKNGWTPAETGAFNKAQNVCRVAQNERIAAALCDEPGMGKSYALKHYAEVNKSTVYIECEEFWNRIVFLKAVAEGLGISGSDTANDLSMLVNDICQAIKKGKATLIIIDEFDKLDDKSWNLWKSLYNKTQDHTGWVLAGAPYFRKRLTTGRRSNKQAYKEIWSRVGQEFIGMKTVTRKDVADICKANGIEDKNLADKFYSGCDGDLRKLTRDIRKEKIRKQNQTA
jgi:DNA transposition AAA+ family ATPase